MKKIFTGLMSLISVIAMFTGCEMVDTSDDLIIGNYKETSESVSESEIVQTQVTLSDISEETAEDTREWELRELWLYSVENSMYTDTIAPDGSPLTLTLPSVSYSYRDMLNFLNDNAYIKKNYTLAETSREQCTYAPFGNYGQHTNASVEKLICGQKINEITNKEDEVLYSDILISVGQDYSTYSKPNYFSVMLSSTAVTYELQTMLYELLASQIDPTIAEYAVYAKTQIDGVNEYDLTDTIPTVDGKGNLHIKRTISGGGIMIELDFQDSSEFDETRYSYYDHGFESIYNESRITLADIFIGEFGGNDPHNDIKFFDKFFETGGRSDTYFSQSIKNNLNTTVTEGTNKIYRNYKFNFDLTKGCIMDMAEAPYFNCDVTAYFDSRSNNNYIQGEGNFISGYTDVNLCTEDEAFTELIEATRTKLYCLFPNIDTSSMKYENFYRKSYNLKGTYNATTSNVPVNTDIHVELNTKYAEETDEDGNTITTDIPLYYYAKVSFSLS